MTANFIAADKTFLSQKVGSVEQDHSSVRTLLLKKVPPSALPAAIVRKRSKIFFDGVC